jgi:hypothetical protein
MEFLVYVFVDVVVLKVVEFNFVLGVENVDKKVVDFEKLQDQPAEVLPYFKRFLCRHYLADVCTHFFLGVLGKEIATSSHFIFSYSILHLGVSSS